MRVVVIGGGIVGCAAAAELAARGVRTVLVERGAIGGGTSSHCEGNLLVSDKPPGPELELARIGLAEWRRTAALLPRELGPAFPDIEYQAKGGLVAALGEPGREGLLALAAAQREAGLTARACTPAQARELEPDLSTACTAAVHHPEDAQIQPLAGTEALAALARRRGARILTGTRVTGPVRRGRRLAGVRTDRGELAADAVVVAAGPWSGAVAERLGAPLPIVPRRGVVLVTARMPERIRHKVYDADYVGAVGSERAELQLSSVVESTAAGTVLIGSSREQIGFDGRLRVEVLRSLARRAIRLFPFLREAALIRSYSGFRPYLPDHLPAIGPDRRLAGLWFATGHEGAGIVLSLPTARLLADLLTGAAPLVDPAPFRPDRPALLRAVEGRAA